MTIMAKQGPPGAASTQVKAKPVVGKKPAAKLKPKGATRGGGVRPEVMALAEESMKRLAPFYRKLAKL